MTALLGALSASGAVAAVGAADLEARVADLEAEVARLLGRVAALEGRRAAPEIGSIPPSAAPVRPAASAYDAAADAAWQPPSDGAVWSQDGALPVRITHQSLDRATGRVDLLVQLTVAPPDPAGWSQAGAPVPLRLRALTPDGIEVAVPLLLGRVAVVEAGAHLHLTATLAPAVAAAASLLVLSAADGTPASPSPHPLSRGSRP